MSNLLSCTNLQLRFPNTPKKPVFNLNFQAGQSWGILGPNGSGKSTLLLTLAGLLTPEQGTVFLQNKPLSSYQPKARAQLLGTLLQSQNIGFNSRVIDLVTQGRFAHLNSWNDFTATDKQAAAQALAQVGLTHLAQRGYTSLSGGEQQRVALAMVLNQNPKIYCLDEPSNHLDLHQQISSLKLIQTQVEQGKMALMALHDLNLAARFCSHFICLFPDGRTLWGKSAEILRLDILQDLYQQELHLSYLHERPFFIPR